MKTSKIRISGNHLVTILLKSLATIDIDKEFDIEVHSTKGKPSTSSDLGFYRAGSTIKYGRVAL
ncbi:MAG: hypothetical protein WCJ03_03970 [Bacteroidales bacterium]